jgi:ammonia channel protein AmtB
VIVGLRVSREEEIKGLDIEEHGTEAYPNDVVNALGVAD